MVWPFVVAVIIGAMVLVGSTKGSSPTLSSRGARNMAMIVLVVGFVLAVLLRLVLWQYLVLIMALCISLAGFGIAIFRAFTRQRWKLLASLLLAVALVPIIILSVIVFDAISNPTTTVRGRVVYGDTGLRAKGVLVQAQTIDASKRQGWGQTVTDENGEYRLKSLPFAQYNIWVKAEGWTTRAIDSLRPGTRVPDLVLLRGTLVRGRVVDAVTGKPATEYQNVGVYGPAMPATGSAVQSAHIESDGTFELRLPSGRNYIYVMRPKSDSGQWLDVPDDGPIDVELLVK